MLTDYSVAKLPARKKCTYYLAACLALCALGLLFYRSFAAGLALCALSLPLERIYASWLAKNRREKLLEGFKDALYSISGAVSAGRQMPFALEAAAASASDSFGENSDISCELKHICEQYRQSHSDIGVMLSDLGRRSALEEIRQFASAYRACQLCGGDLEDVCRKNAELLISRMSFAEETRSLIAQKKLDIILLTGMPLAVLLLLNLISYSYIAVLYETAAGRVVMTLCLLLIVSALLWGIKITNIEL